MTEPDKPQDGTEGEPGPSAWFTPEERSAILSRAYPDSSEPELALGPLAFNGGIAVLVTMAITPVLLALTPALLIGHAILRALGRNGFTHSDSRGLHYRFDWSAFRFVSPGQGIGEVSDEAPDQGT